MLNKKSFFWIEFSEHFKSNNMKNLFLFSMILFLMRNLSVYIFGIFQKKHYKLINSYIQLDTNMFLTRKMLFYRINNAQIFL